MKVPRTRGGGTHLKPQAAFLQRDPAQNGCLVVSRTLDAFLGPRLLTGSMVHLNVGLKMDSHIRGQAWETLELTGEKKVSSTGQKS